MNNHHLSHTIFSQGILCVLLFLTAPIWTQAQPDEKPARLLAMLRETPPDTNQVTLLLELGEYYLYKPDELQVDLDSAHIFFQKAFQLGEVLRSERWMETSEWWLALCHFENKDVEQGRAVFQKTIQRIQRRKDKRELAEAYFDMGLWMFRSHVTNDERIRYYEQARDLFREIGDQKRAVDALKEIGDVHLNQGKLDDSEKELLEVIEQYKSIGYRELHYTYDLLAAVSTLKGNMNRALLYGLEMIKSMETTGDSAMANVFYYRMARIYRDLGQPEKSVLYFKKSFAKNTSSDFGGTASLVGELIKLGRAKEALATVQGVVAKEAPITMYDEAVTAMALGNCYQALQQYELAEKYYRDMLHSEKQLNKHNHFTSTVNFTMGEFYVKKLRYLDAMPYLQKVLDIPPGIVTLQRLSDTHMLLFKVDSAASDYLSAIRHLQQHKMLDDSIFNEAKSHQIEELQIQYETENKERNIKLLQNASALQESRLRQMNLTKNLTFGGGVLLLIILGLVYNRFRLKQRSARQLELQQIEINQTNNTLQTLVEEKERLLREIHHRVKNNLQIVMSLLNSQSVFLDNETALTAIRDSQHRIHSISLIHQKLYQSKDAALIDMSIYIRELTDYLQDSFDTGKTIRFDLNVEPVVLDVTQAVPVGLILNEAISNAIKYAFPGKKTGTVKVSMCYADENHFTLNVADDGVGLPPDFDIEKCNSLGMSLMQGLSKQLHGNFDLKSGKGLTITTTFEIQQVTKPDVIASSVEGIT